MYALAPKDGASALALAGIALCMAGFGAWALIKLRTWSLFALSGAGIASLLSVSTLNAASPIVSTLGLMAGALLLLTASPFIGPIYRSLKRR